MHNETIIIVVLVILVVIVIITIMKGRETFTTCPRPAWTHDKDTCPNYIFDNDGFECSDDVPDIHVNRFVESGTDEPMLPNTNIHYVNPYNSCCIRTCIKDFTYTEDEAIHPHQLPVGKNVGEYRTDIPLDMLFSSRCAQCLTRFETALNMIKNPDTCTEVNV
jgi:hypothetical protein